MIAETRPSGRVQPLRPLAPSLTVGFLPNRLPFNMKSAAGPQTPHALGFPVTFHSSLFSLWFRSPNPCF